MSDDEKDFRDFVKLMKSIELKELKTVTHVIDSETKQNLTNPVKVKELLLGKILKKDSEGYLINYDNFTVLQHRLNEIYYIKGNDMEISDYDLEPIFDNLYRILDDKYEYPNFTIRINLNTNDFNEIIDKIFSSVVRFVIFIPINNRN